MIHAGAIQRAGQVEGLGPGVEDLGFEDGVVRGVRGAPAGAVDHQHRLVGKQHDVRHEATEGGAPAPRPEPTIALRRMVSIELEDLGLPRRQLGGARVGAIPAATMRGTYVFTTRKASVEAYPSGWAASES